MENKKFVVISGVFHKKIKRRAVENETTIQIELNEILKNSLKIDGETHVK